MSPLVDVDTSPALPGGACCPVAPPASLIPRRGSPSPVLARAMSTSPPSLSTGAPPRRPSSLPPPGTVPQLYRSPPEQFPSTIGAPPRRPVPPLAAAASSGGPSRRRTSSSWPKHLLQSHGAAPKRSPLTPRASAPLPTPPRMRSTNGGDGGFGGGCRAAAENSAVGFGRGTSPRRRNDSRQRHTRASPVAETRTDSTLDGARRSDGPYRGRRRTAGEAGGRVPGAEPAVGEVLPYAFIFSSPASNLTPWCTAGRPDFPARTRLCTY
mmetsp:Transcript_42061/g.127580  ORF Transcript_42061/g.127580 Transcript_42061/m.127580 type:complete len:267 (+) Transcript_42061:790-1590(+)